MPRIPNPYGYFDTDRREYVITRPDTPTPWINYLGQGKYGGIVSNTGGGYSFDRDPRNRRVTRYRYNGIPVDQPGRYIYLRDQETGDYWSATWQPTTARKLDFYECRHGPGYTEITSRYRDVTASVRYFVPLDAPCEIWVLSVRNEHKIKRTFRAFSYAELSYFDAMVDQTNLDWGSHIVRSQVVDNIIQTGVKFRPETTFHATNGKIVGYDSDREVFLGNYRDLSNPIVVEKGSPANSLAPRGNNIGSFCVEFDVSFGETKEIVFILGVVENHDAIAPLVKRFRNEENVNAAFEALKADWNQYLNRFKVQTPDEEMNAMLNTLNPLQCRTTLYWSRFASAYETGLGRGIGTRDSGQDTLATVVAAPEHTRTMLTNLWKLQFKDGHTWHQYFPLTGEGGPGLAAEFPDWPQWFCDDHLWLVIATAAYLRESGDLAFLQQRLPYQDGGEDAIWEHMLRAMQFTLDHRGPHGLPRLGFSDWDDTMNLDHGSGKAESVWCGMQFCRAALDMAELSGFLGRKMEEARFRNIHKEMATIIERHCWDGDWYARAYDDHGVPVGVKSETYHKIALNPQTWSIIGEIGNRERAARAMESAHKELNTNFGLVIMKPAYPYSDPRVRGTSTMQAGSKENGGIFCHANTWAIVAAALLGWGDRAYQYYRQILPLTRQDADLFKVEPYVYCQNICGPEHPQFGMGRNSWLTGTAAWTYVAGTQYILGIRPTFTGLRIAPALPDDWKGFTAQRVFRGVTYDITVDRRGTGKTVSLTVDGRPVSGDVVPIPAPGTKEVKVQVVLV